MPFSLTNSPRTFLLLSFRHTRPCKGRELIVEDVGTYLATYVHTSVASRGERASRLRARIPFDTKGRSKFDRLERTQAPSGGTSVALVRPAQAEGARTRTGGRGEARSMESGIIADVDRLKESRRGDPLPYLCNERPLCVSCLRPRPSPVRPSTSPLSSTTSTLTPPVRFYPSLSPTSPRSIKLLSRSLSLKIRMSHWVHAARAPFLLQPRSSTLFLTKDSILPLLETGKTVHDRFQGRTGGLPLSGLIR